MALLLMAPMPSTCPSGGAGDATRTAENSNVTRHCCAMQNIGRARHRLDALTEPTRLGETRRAIDALRAVSTGARSLLAELPRSSSRIASAGSASCPAASACARYVLKADAALQTRSPARREVAKPGCRLSQAQRKAGAGVGVSPPDQAADPVIGPADGGSSNWCGPRATMPGAKDCSSATPWRAQHALGGRQRQVADFRTGPARLERRGRADRGAATPQPLTEAIARQRRLFRPSSPNSRTRW